MIQVTWTARDSIALAVSGGVDSMVLLHLLLNEFKDTYQSLTLLHVNHGLREASRDEAAFLASYAEQQDVKIYTTNLDFSGSHFTQESARDARYRFFFDVMQKHEIHHLLTAHHKDDDLETLMNQIFSYRPPLGIALIHTHGMFTLHRPLLHLRKESIYAYAHKENVTYFEDASNQENDYTRNYIRNEVLPSIDSYTHLATDGLNQLKSDYADFNRICEAKFESVNTSIPRQTLINLTRFEQAFVLRKLSGDVYLGRTYIEEIIKTAASDVSNAEFQTDARTLVIAYEKVFVKKEAETTTQLDITEAGHYLFNDYVLDVHQDILPLYIRTFKPGDKMQLDFGVKKVARMFIDEKIPKHLRSRIPIVENQSGEIIAVGTMYNIIDRKLLNIERETANDIERRY